MGCYKWHSARGKTKTSATVPQSRCPPWSHSIISCISTICVTSWEYVTKTQPGRHLFCCRYIPKHCKGQQHLDGLECGRIAVLRRWAGIDMLFKYVKACNKQLLFLQGIHIRTQHWTYLGFTVPYSPRQRLLEPIQTTERAEVEGTATPNEQHAKKIATAYTMTNTLLSPLSTLTCTFGN